MGTPVLPTECRRKSPLLLPPPSRSRSLLLPRGSTPYGSVAPSWLPSPPSSRCGSPSRSTTSAAHPLSTASASKLLDHCQHIHTDLIQLFLIKILFSTCYLLYVAKKGFNNKNRIHLHDIK